MTEVSRSPEKAEHLSRGPLDALRFLASIFIVVFHYGPDAPVALDRLNPLMGRGYLATNFFLILSGFVLAISYGGAVERGRLTTPRFMAKRIRRIWPGHLAMLAVFAAFILLTHAIGVAPQHPERFGWPALGMQALLVQAWGISGGEGWNLPTWTLSALMVCYLMFPALWRALARAPSAAWSLAACAGALFVADLLCRTFLGNAVYDLPFRLGVVRAVPLFALGAAAAQLVRRAPLPGAGWLLAGSAVGLIALQQVGRWDFLSMMLLVGVVLGASSLRWGNPQLTAWAANGGRLSFPLFLTHIFASALWFGGLHALHHGLIGPALAWTFWAGGLAFALVLAFAFDRFVDQPLQTLTAPLASLRLMRAAPEPAASSAA